MKKEFQELKAKYEAAETEYEAAKTVLETLTKRRDTLAIDLPNLEEELNKAQDENNHVIRRRALGKASEEEHAKAFEALNDASFNFDRVFIEHATIVSEVDKTQQGIDTPRHSLRHAKEAFWRAVQNDAIASAVKAAGPHLVKIQTLTMPSRSMSSYMSDIVKDVFKGVGISNGQIKPEALKKLEEEYGVPT